MEEKQTVNLIKRLLTLTPISFTRCTIRKDLIYHSKIYDRYYIVGIMDYADNEKSVTLTIKKDLFGDYLNVSYIKDERSRNEIAYAVSDIVDQLEAQEMQLLDKYIAEQEYKGMDSLLPDNAE